MRYRLTLEFESGDPDMNAHLEDSADWLLMNLHDSQPALGPFVVLLNTVETIEEETENAR